MENYLGVFINGRFFFSVKSASKHLGESTQSITSRIHSKYYPEYYYGRKNPLIKEVICEGVTYPSISMAAFDLEIEYFKLRRWVQSDSHKYRDYKYKGVKKFVDRRIVIEGEYFESLTEAASSKGISIQCLSRRLSSTSTKFIDWHYSNVTKIAKDSNGFNQGIRVVVNGRYYVSIKEACNDLGVSRMFLKRRLDDLENKDFIYVDQK
jgi:hypothetical protein